MDHGANLDVVDEGGYSPLALSVVKGKYEVVKYLAPLCKSLINVGDVNSDTPLHHAFQVQVTEIYD